MCEFKKTSSNTLDPTFGFMHYLEHLKFLEYFMWVENETGRNANCRRSNFDVICV